MSVIHALVLMEDEYKAIADLALPMRRDFIMYVLGTRRIDLKEYTHVDVYSPSEDLMFRVLITHSTDKDGGA